MARIQTLPKLRPDSTDREGLGYIYRRRLPSGVVPGCHVLVILHTFKFDFIESAGLPGPGPPPTFRRLGFRRRPGQGFRPGRGPRDPSHLGRDARAGAGSCGPESGPIEGEPENPDCARGRQLWSRPAGPWPSCSGKPCVCHGEGWILAPTAESIAESGREEQRP